MALLGVAGGEHDGYLGIAASGGLATWAPVEVLRIAGDRVTERRAIAAVGVHAAPLFAARLAPAPSSATVTDRAPVLALRVDRLTIAPGAAFHGSDGAGSLVVVETGNGEATVDGVSAVLRAGGHGPDWIALPAGDRVLLAAGDALSVPAGAWHRVRAAGGAPATVLRLTLGAAVFPEAASADRPERATPLAGAGAGVTLAPGTFVTGIGARELTVVVVEVGMLTAEIGGVRRNHGAGSALIVLAGNAALLRNAGPEPLSVLILTVGADADGPAS